MASRLESSALTRVFASSLSKRLSEGPLLYVEANLSLDGGFIVLKIRVGETLCRLSSGRIASDLRLRQVSQNSHNWIRL